jgi:hypothetical protein
MPWTTAVTGRSHPKDPPHCPSRRGTPRLFSASRAPKRDAIDFNAGIALRLATSYIMG